MTKAWYQGFYKRSIEERYQLLKDHLGLTAEQSQLLFSQFDPLSSQLIENYLTDYHLPEGLVVGLVVNGKEYAIPMVVEEPSVVAAASNGAQRIAKSGGFTAQPAGREIIGQVVLENIADYNQTQQWILDHETEILAVANQAHPSLLKRGAGAVAVRARQVEPFVSVDLVVNVSQAMGANSVNTMAEAVGHWFSQQGYQVLTAILSNYAIDSLQTVTGKVHVRDLGTVGQDGRVVAQKIAQLSQLSQVDPYRATTHNKGIMNGIGAAVIASGNDWRAIESGAHAYASRDGQYRGLSQWHLDGDYLIGEMTLPMSVGVVGGSIKLLPQSQINYQLSQVESAEELAGVIASVGLAQNLAALRALGSTGIQAGHMKLQYRSLAISVGAKKTEIKPLLAALIQAPRVDTQVASKLLQELRGEK